MNWRPGLDFRALFVLSVEVDSILTPVDNLEIADAHTYLAGELEGWGHNSRSGGLRSPVK